MDYLQIPVWSAERSSLGSGERLNIANIRDSKSEKALMELCRHLHIEKLSDAYGFYKQTSTVLGCHFSNIEELLYSLHFSSSHTEYSKAVTDIRKWATLSLFINCRKRMPVKAHSKSMSKTEITSTLNALIPCLPFKPTIEQLKASINCLSSFTSGSIQRHMLYGDVGYGKTTPIGLIAASCVINGWTAVVMCPLTPLANQIYNTFKSWFSSVGINIKLVTSETEETRIEPGTLYIGTTALLHCNIHNVDILIVDEEQKFGVSQINKLVEKNCHYLASSATPIPRTVSLISLGLFKELALTKPFVEKCISSSVIKHDEFSHVISSVRKCLDQGGQALFICCQKQMTTSSNKSHILSCEEAYDKLKVFFPNDIVLVNSDVSHDDAERNFKLLRDGKKSILVATTSIEVGIDLARAFYIGIFNPERFGMAQLHQLRGRVGRQGDYAECHLITSDKVNSEQHARLAFFTRTTNGRVIAEYDADRRGWGSLFDTKQSGKYQHTFLSDFSPTVQEMTNIRNIFLDKDEA